MAIADFHNDILTCDKFSGLPLEYSKHRIVTAIFRGNKSFEDAFSLTKYSNLLAFEDVGYTDLNFDKLIYDKV